MSEFKSFNEFQKELHHESPVAETPESPPASPPEEPEKKEHRLGRYIHRIPHEGIKTYLMGLSAVVLVIVAALLFLPIPFGAVRLTGNETLTLDDVLFDGAVKQPVNVWQISTSDMKDRLGKDIRIGSVEVVRSFPLYIDVNITERKPLAVIQGDFGYALLDKEGVVLRTVSSLRGIDLPVVTGIKLGNILLGDTASQPVVQAALQFLGGLSASGNHAFSEVNVGNESNLVAYTREGIPVWLGDGDRMTERAALAEKMLNDMKVRHLAVEHIDASLTSPYFKTKI